MFCHPQITFPLMREDAEAKSVVRSLYPCLEFRASASSGLRAYREADGGEIAPEKWEQRRSRIPGFLTGKYSSIIIR
jgi:hypothetical protein